MNGLKVKDSKIAGKGLFADKEFNEGSIIGIAHINNNPTGMIGKFHNHSDNPNAHSITIGNKKYLAALRPLMKGEEITVDYRKQPELEQPEEFQNGGEKGDKFKKRLMKRYPGMQGVYGAEGENLNIVKDPNYDARSAGYGDIEFTFPGDDPVLNYPNLVEEGGPDYNYPNPSPDKYTALYNPRGANRGDIFLDMMHGMRNDPNYQPLLQNFEKAVRDARGEDMDYYYDDQVKKGSTQSKERYDENYIDSQLRAELAPGSIGMFSKGRKDYRMERKYDSPEMRAAAKDVRNYLKGEYQDGGEPKKKKRKTDDYGRYRSEDGNVRTPLTPEMQAVMPPDEWGQYIQEFPEVYTTRTKEQQDAMNAARNMQWLNQQNYQRAPHLYLPDGSLRPQAAQSADWVWQLGALGAASGLGKSAVGAAETLGTKALPYLEGALNTSIPGMASIPGATIGNAAGAYFAGDAIVNRLYPSAGKIQEGKYGEAAADIGTGLLDLYGANMLSPVYKGAKATASELGKFLGTEEGLLSNTYKYNRWALKENPEMLLYRTQPKNFKAGITEEEEIKSLITDKIIKGEKVPIWLHGKLLKIQNDPEPFRAALNQYHGQWFDKNPQRMEWYMKGRLDDVEGDILRLKLPKQEGLSYNLKNFPEAQKASLNYDTEFIVPREKLFEAEKFSTNDLQQLIQEDAAFNKPHWLKGFEEGPKELPGSPNNSLSIFPKKPKPIEGIELSKGRASRTLYPEPLFNPKTGIKQRGNTTYLGPVWGPKYRGNKYNNSKYADPALLDEDMRPYLLGEDQLRLRYPWMYE